MNEEPIHLRLHRDAIDAFNSDDQKTALRLLNEAIDLEPTDPALHNSIGAIYRAIGAIGPAVAHFQESIALNPEFSMPRDNLLRTIEITGPNVPSSGYDISIRGERRPASPKVLVVSHERSGTHLLINTLAFNFGYLCHWIDVRSEAEDETPNPIPHLFSFKDKTVSNVFKSHHARPLFGEDLGDLAEHFKIIYIVRDPRDAMTSFWRFAGQSAINEGPRASTVDAFVRSPPEGRPLVFEYPPSSDMITRWRQHVSGWLGETETDNVHLVRYEDLIGDFDDTLGALETFMETPARHRLIPDLALPAVGTWKGKIGNWRNRMSVETKDYIQGVAGPLMNRLGYETD